MKISTLYTLLTVYQNCLHWKGPLEIIWSSSPCSRSHLEKVFRNHALNISTLQPLWATCASTWSLWQGKDVFSCVKTEFHKFLFLPIASCLTSGYYWEESGFLFIPSYQVHINEILPDPSFLQAEQSQISHPPFIWRCSGPFIIFVSLYFLY